MIKQLNNVCSTWSYNHKHLIVTISLGVALVVQVYAVQLRGAIDSLTYNVTVHNAEARVSCDYDCLTRQWVELRAQEILDENMPSYEVQAKYQALGEINEMNMGLLSEYKETRN